MNIQSLKALCRRFPGAEERLHGPPSNILVYRVGDKFFAYFKTSDPERWRFSIKVTPERFLELTDQPGIKPARWMGRYHWVTIVDVKRFPDDYLRELVAWSHRAALEKLSRRKRMALTGEDAAPTPRKTRSVRRR